MRTRSTRSDVRRFLLSLARLLPLCALVPIVNYVVDPGALYRDLYPMERRVGGHLARHERTAINIGWRDFNWREVYRERIDRMEEIADVVLLGSSTCFEVRERFIDEGSFESLALTGANLEDLATISHLLRRRGLRPRIVLLGIDPGMFR